MFYPLKKVINNLQKLIMIQIYIDKIVIKYLFYELL